MKLLWGTLVHRWYVAGFLAAGVWAARRDLGLRGALAAAAAAFGAGLGFELASTRWGVPFGGFTYSQSTRTRELFLSNVPLFTPLSYVFMGWIALGTARWARPGRVRLATLGLAAVLFAWMDLVVDPVTVRGRAWFLGEVFRYRSRGQYLGVPASNFGGWLLLGVLVAVAYALAHRQGPRATWRSPAVVIGVCLFALGVAGSVGAWTVLVAGAGWTAALALSILALRQRRTV